MGTLVTTIIVAACTALAFVSAQVWYFSETMRYRNRFHDFFKKNLPYSTAVIDINNENFTQLVQVGKPGSDLNNLIAEINHYVVKTKGTTDFSVIQNKVERKLNMRYDQSTAKLSFPTYIGLMGTFVGVFLGILMFVLCFDGSEGVTDDSIRNLLIGVLVSMSTSFIGLLLTTINNARSAESRKKIEEDKNEFYDFVQTELMPSLDESMTVAINRLHETVDKFGPVFDGVINRFQNTFDKCTAAFGRNFEQNVIAVSGAVSTMGKNMDKINENIQYQKELLSVFRSKDLIVGMDKYIEAANHFVSITKSLNKFEEARQMMLAATQEAINIQNAYSESLRVPREVAVRVNSILDRIKDFENNLNELGPALAQRKMIGIEMLDLIKEQVQAIRKKQKIADNYIETADGKLEDLFKVQSKTIDQMNYRYKEAIERHIDGFERMLQAHTKEIELRHEDFKKSLEENISLDVYRAQLSPLKRLDSIEQQLVALSRSKVRTDEIENILYQITNEIHELKDQKGKKKRGRGLFGLGKRK